jgi:23S rRNA (cytosine1962-C5)-methyltransferase
LKKTNDDASGKAKTLKLRVSPKAESILRRGHPWLFSESIREQNREGKTGEMAIIYDRNNAFLGIGLFDSTSPIRVRMLHVGKPQNLDTAWWKSHFTKTVERRKKLFDLETTGFRLCNGESDGWPGFILDQYDRTLVLKLYTASWFSHLQTLLPILNHEIPNQRIVLRLSRNIQTQSKDFNLSDGQVICGEPLSENVVFKETGIRFEADVLRGQKTGFFLDQRENRRIVETLSRDRKVLNAFSVSGGFSLYAARGGAKSLTDVDISEHALESSNRNFQLNKENSAIRKCFHQTIKANVFDWLKETKEQFDLIIIDPPSLAKKEIDREEATHAYDKLVRQGMELLRPKGILVAASCSAHVSSSQFFELVNEAAQKTGRRFKQLLTTGHAPDHPSTFPEAEYLKCIYLEF